MSLVKLNQKQDSLFKILPLSGIPFGIITSNAEILSVDTMRSLYPRSYMSLTFPFLGFKTFVIWSSVLIIISSVILINLSDCFFIKLRKKITKSKFVLSLVMFNI